MFTEYQLNTDNVITSTVMGEVKARLPGAPKRIIIEEFANDLLMDKRYEAGKLYNTYIVVTDELGNKSIVPNNDEFLDLAAIPHEVHGV